MNICPKGCIAMEADIEGFLYPVTDNNTCIGCNACNRVCPVLKQRKTSKPLSFASRTKAYAAYYPDEDILANSSSGGAFTALASEILHSEGVVYGAAWEGDIVKHIKIESISELNLLRGSKYVQSRVEMTFREIKEFLKQGRKVLFSGTPCQIAGLKAYLPTLSNLILVEIACHGAPSPKVLQKYFDELHLQYGEDIKLDFRSKPNGDWRDYRVTAQTAGIQHFSENQKENVFMKGFLRELYSRPICHECPFKSGASGADITLADFWGIEYVLPDFPSKSGVSLMLTHSEKGEMLLSEIDYIKTQEVPVATAITMNGALINSETPHPERAYFFKNLDKYKFSILVEKCTAIRFVTGIKLRAKAYLAKLRIK